MLAEQESTGEARTESDGAPGGRASPRELELAEADWQDTLRLLHGWTVEDRVRWWWWLQCEALRRSPLELLRRRREEKLRHALEVAERARGRHARGGRRRR